MTALPMLSTVAEHSARLEHQLEQFISDATGAKSKALMARIEEVRVEVAKTRVRRWLRYHLRRAITERLWGADHPPLPLPPGVWGFGDDDGVVQVADGLSLAFACDAIEPGDMPVWGRDDDWTLVSSEAFIAGLADLTAEQRERAAGIVVRLHQLLDGLTETAVQRCDGYDALQGFEPIRVRSARNGVIDIGARTPLQIGLGLSTMRGLPESPVGRFLIQRIDR